MIENKFEKLEVWKEAHKLVLSIYKITKKFPKEEQFRLVDQVCRSSSSVGANIVEGSSRQHTKELIQFLYLSKGSLEETKYHLLLSKDLGYISSQEYELLINQAELVGKLLYGFIKFVLSKNYKSDNLYHKS